MGHLQLLFACGGIPDPRGPARTASQPGAIRAERQRHYLGPPPDRQIPDNGCRVIPLPTPSAPNGGDVRRLGLWFGHAPSPLMSSGPPLR